MICSRRLFIDVGVVSQSSFLLRASWQRKKEEMLYSTLFLFLSTFFFRPPTLSCMDLINGVCERHEIDDTKKRKNGRDRLNSLC